MAALLVLEAFGELPSTGIITSERARERRELEGPPTAVAEVGFLHRTFEARAELLGWSGLWDLYEAGLVSSGADPSMIGWVYVGLASGADLSDLDPDPLELDPLDLSTAGWAVFTAPAGDGAKTATLSAILPPLIQCLDDALRRIGATQISGFQLTCYGELPGEDGRNSHLNLGRDWFDLAGPAGVEALITFDRGFLGAGQSTGMMDHIRRRRTGTFRFGQVVTAPEPYQIRVSTNTPKPDVVFESSDFSLLVELPEWSPSAAAWALATVIDVALGYAETREGFVIRIGQVGPVTRRNPINTINNN